MMDRRNIIPSIRFLRQAETNNLDPSACWIWKGNINSNGYGRFVIGNKHKLAHRVSFELFVGNIPDGQNVCHTCDDRLCVNPHHLWLGSQSENLADAVSKGRLTPPDTRGERNGNRKLTASDVSKIRDMFKSGIKRFLIARHYNVSPSTIGEIISNKTWKEVA